MNSRAGGERSRVGRPTSAEAARLTERIRRAAVDTFLKYGYDGTTMEAVAQAAGITKSTLYARYPDKRALFIAVSSWALTRQERDQRVLEPLPDDLAESLTVIARAILARSVDPDIVRLSRMAIAESQRFPEFAVNSQAVTWSPRIQVIMDLLRRHEREGAVVVPNVEIAAEQFFAMVGAMPAWLAAYGIYRTPDEEERRIRHAVELFLNGVLVRRDGSPPPGPGGDGRPPASPALTAAVAATASGTAADTAADTVTAAVAGTAAAPAVDTATTDTAPADTAAVGPAVAAAWPTGPVPAAPMEYRRLGRSGLRVSRLALGTMAFGLPGRGCDERTAAELIHRYLDAGGNLLDTADAYGAAEEICGRVLRGRRSEVVLATKVGMPTGPGPNDGGNGRRRIRQACEASLRRLRTDYIDLYQLHLDDPGTPLEETIEALDDLVRAGKVLYVGASNLPAYRLMKALSVSDRLGRARFVSLQGGYHLLERTAEREHLPLLAEEGLGFISAGPLDAALLAGRLPPPCGSAPGGHPEETHPAGTRPAGAPPGKGQPEEERDALDALIENPLVAGGRESAAGPAAVPAAVRRAAAELGCTTAQLALAWQRTRPVTSVVVDARTVTQLEEHLAALSIEIPAEIAAELDRLTRPPGGHPRTLADRG